MVQIGVEPLGDGSLLRRRGWPENPKGALSVGHLFMLAASQERELLNTPSLVQWTIRAAIASGYVAPPVVAPRPMTGDSELWQGVALLLACHRLGGEPVGQPVPMARRFMAGWCGLQDDLDGRRTGFALARLERAGVIDRAVPPATRATSRPPLYFVVAEDGQPLDLNVLRSAALRRRNPLGVVTEPRKPAEGEREPTAD